MKQLISFFMIGYFLITSIASAEQEEFNLKKEFKQNNQTQQNQSFSTEIKNHQNPQIILNKYLATSSNDQKNNTYLIDSKTKKTNGQEFL